VPYDAWVDFALRGAAPRGWPAGRAVDLGCGTGNASAALLRRGLEVVGVDASEPMLAVARRKLDVPLLLGDMRSVALPGAFDLALSVFDTVNNLLEDGDLAAVARHVHRHLAPGGGWVFDANTEAGLEALWDGDVAEGWADDVHFRWTHRWDPRARRATVEAWCAGPGGSFTEVHQERPYDADEIRSVLLASGFERVDVVAYPGGMPADPDAPRVWVFASRGTGAP